MTPKSPSFKSVLLFKMQTRQIETHTRRSAGIFPFLTLGGDFFFFLPEKSDYSNGAGGRGGGWGWGWGALAE